MNSCTVYISCAKTIAHAPSQHLPLSVPCQEVDDFQHLCVVSRGRKGSR